MTTSRLIWIGRSAYSISLARWGSAATTLHAPSRPLGKSPYAYVVECRIEEAKRQLLETGASLAEIALATGFGSQSHFTTRFRRSTGVTPRVFRLTQ